MEFYIGQILLVPFSSVPEYSYPCDGRTILIASHNALFALLGTRFGGNGVNEFKIPDLRSVTPPGMMYAIFYNGIFPSRP